VETEQEKTMSNATMGILTLVMVALIYAKLKKIMFACLSIPSLEAPMFAIVMLSLCQQPGHLIGGLSKLALPQV
jgi:hypothetical protein